MFLPLKSSIVDVHMIQIKAKRHQDEYEKKQKEHKIQNPNQLRFVRLHFDYLHTWFNRIVASSSSTNKSINLKSQAKMKRERDENENQMATLKTMAQPKNTTTKTAIRFLIDKVVEYLELNGLVYINRGATALSCWWWW